MYLPKMKWSSVELFICKYEALLVVMVPPSLLIFFFPAEYKIIFLRLQALLMSGSLL